MTITERNQRLYELRKELHDANMLVLAIKSQIYYTNEEYDRQNRPSLYEEMFGNWCIALNRTCHPLKYTLAHISFGLLSSSIAWVCIRNWCDGRQTVPNWPQSVRPCAYNGCMNNFTITCPALGETETTTDLDRAMDIFFAMHDESDSYAYIRDAFGDIVGEYGDVMGAVADQLI